MQTQIQLDTCAASHAMANEVVSRGFWLMDFPRRTLRPSDFSQIPFPFQLTNQPTNQPTNHQVTCKIVSQYRNAAGAPKTRPGSLSGAPDGGDLYGCKGSSHKPKVFKPLGY